MNTTLRVRIAFAIVLAISLTALVLSYLTTVKLIDANRLVTRTNGAFMNLEGTVAALDNLERSRLAWINAGRAMHNLRVQRFRELSCRMCHGSQTHALEAERFRHTQIKMVASLNRNIQGLRSLIALEPAQRERLSLLDPLIRKKVALAEQETEPLEAGAFWGPESIPLDQDVQLTDDIRKIIGEMERAEDKLLSGQLEEREATARGEIVAVSLLGLLTICVAVLAYVIIRRDLARRELLEEQLRQTAKMEAVGRLAGGVAHDFNNLLMPILGYAELLETDLGNLHPLIGHVGEIRKAGETAASVTRQLLAFSRKQTLQPRKLDLNTVATKMGNLLRRLIGDQFQLELALEPALGWVEADPSQVEQVIMNLVLNARDAVPKGGIIVVETANVTVHGEKICWCGLPLEGDFVVLAVSDDGAGMDEPTRSRVFEPFFTTKERGKGTGLGLATVYGIVTQSNGRVRVESALDQGTTFEIYLPRVEPPRESAPPRPVRARVPARQGTILLVEDDEPVFRLVRSVLAASGYHILEARDGEEALAQASTKPIDLLVTDLVMPKLNGLDLHQKLAGQRPGLKTIFMSGHAAGIVGLESALDESTVFLTKPFTPRDLLQKVGRLLPDRRRATEPRP